MKMPKPSLSDRTALLRFVSAVETGKRPRVVDARMAVAYIRQITGEPPAPPRTPKKRGQPADKDKHFRDVAHKVDAALAVARLVGESREPGDADYVIIGDRKGMSKSTVRRHWEAYGARVRRQIADEKLMASLMRVVGEMDRAGVDIDSVSWPTLRRYAEQWRTSNSAERERLLQKIHATIVAKQ